MAAITDGLSSIAATALGGKRTFVLPSPSSREAGRGQVASSAGGIEFSPRGDLGRRFEAHGHEWAEAARIRQRSERLGQVASDLEGTRVRLEQVKLYPPYPVDESRRAQAIRQFNGLAAEAARLVHAETTPTPLPATASTAEAQAAVDQLGVLSARISSERAALASNGPNEQEAHQVEASSLELGQALSEESTTRLTRSGDVLRLIA